MPGPFYEYNATESLHILKDAWGQKAWLGPQSKLLAENLPAAIEATYAAAHERTQGFRLNRPLNEMMDDRSRERCLEAAMFRRWNQPNMWRIPGCWERLIAFQVPLYAQRDAEQWGDIDLLGMNADGLPVVIELKAAPNSHLDGQTRPSETPLRMLVEAGAYAVALRKNWASQFRTEWIARLRELGVLETVIDAVPETLSTVPLVAAAPASYWIDWLAVTEKGRTVSRETWLSFQALLGEFERASLPVSFVSISGTEGDDSNLAAQPLVGFPPVS